MKRHIQSECCSSHCSHHHHENKNSKKILIITLSAFFLIIALLIERKFNPEIWQLFLIYLIPYFLSGFQTLKEAIENIFKGDIFNEDFLMTLATAGALCIGFLPNADNEFSEAVLVMLLFQIGELFEGYAEGKSRKSISHLLEIRPDTALVERNGQTIAVPPDEVKINETIILKPGDKIPLDGTIIDGCSSINTMALTGESVPREVSANDTVLSGCINLTGVLRVRTTKNCEESTASKIIKLVENADSNKSRSESFITQFARIYTPIVVLLAISIAFIPPFFSTSGFQASFSEWLHRALIFLVVSCPCALVISVPLTFFGGLGCASRNGILIKGSNFIDLLAKINVIAFDKTGTLTKGVFKLDAIHPHSISETEILHLAAHAEHFSTHPIGIALRNAFPNESTDGCNIDNIKEISGKGICAKINGQTIYVGNSKLMNAINVKWHDCHLTGTVIHIARKNQYIGHIIVNDQIKEDSENTISALRNIGIKRIILLTGDKKETAEHVANQVGIKEYHAELLPIDKLNQLNQIRKQNKNSIVAFVGDGINDAPVLKSADLGIAMGALGSDAAIESSDVVLMDDMPSKIPLAIKIAKRTISIARQNVWLAIGIKILVLFLAAIGMATMWMAIFADVGVTVIAVFNAMRALTYHHKTA